jgi:uncharacterized integral membrane protein
MRKLVQLIAGLFLLLVLVLSLVFLRANDAPAALSFGRWETGEQAIGLWVVSAFVLGCVLGLLVGLRLFRSLLNRVEIAKLRRRIEKLEREKVQ